MRNAASALAVTRPLLRMTSSSSPPSMPAALVTAPELEPVPEEPKATVEPPEEAWVDVALTLSSPSFVMLSRPFPPAMPVDRVEAVSEPLVPPVPPKVNDELVRFEEDTDPLQSLTYLVCRLLPATPAMPTAAVASPHVSPVAALANT